MWRWRRLRRFFEWLPIVWRDQPWGYGYLWPILEHKFAQMERHHREAQFVAGWEETADELRRARLVCERLRRDDYWRHPKYVTWRIDGEPYDQEQADIDYLFGLMRRKLRTWWD